MKKRIIQLFTLIFVALMLFTSTVKAANKTRYIAVILADPANKQLAYKIIKESEKTTLICRVNGANKTCKSTDSLSGKGEEISGGLLTSQFVFPGGDAEIGTSYADLGQAENVIGTLVGTANSIIKAYMSGTNEISFNDALARLAAHGANDSYNGVTLSEGGSGKDVSTWDRWAKDANHWFYGGGSYVTITIGSNSSYYGIWSAPKGYGSGQALESRGANVVGDESTITVQEIATFANTAFQNGIALSGGEGYEVFQKEGLVQTMFEDFAENLSSSFAPSALGLFSIEELIFNRGLRGNSYYLGMMPVSWYNGVSYMFWGAEAIAIVILFAGIIRLLGKRSLAIMSPTERVDLREGIMNTLIAIVLLVLYPFIFYVMGNLNFTLVKALDAYTKGAGFVSIGRGYGAFPVLIITIFSLFMIAKLNVDYLVRAVSLTVLHVIAPIAIGSMGLSGRRGLFSTWFRELMVNVLLQTFDALILTIILVVAGTSATWLESIIFAYMFSPLNRWFKDNVMGFRGAGSDGAAAQTFNTAQKSAQIAQNQVGNTAAGFAASARASGLGQSVKDLFTAKDSGDGESGGDGPKKGGKFGLNPDKLGEVGKKVGQALGTGVSYNAANTVLGNRFGGEVLSGMTAAQAKQGKDVLHNFESYKQNNEEKREQAYNQYDYATQHAGEDYANKLEQVKQDAFDNNEDYAKRYYEDRGYGDWDKLSYDEKSDFMYNNESRITSSIDMDNARQYYEAHPDTNLESNIQIPGVNATRGWDDLSSSEQQTYMKEHSAGIQSEYSNDYVTTAQQNKEMQNFVDDNANFKWLQNNAGGYKMDSNGLPQVGVKDGKSAVVANLDAEASVQQQSVMHGFDYKTKSFDEYKKSRV